MMTRNLTIATLTLTLGMATAAQADLIVSVTLNKSGKPFTSDTRVGAEVGDDTAGSRADNWDFVTVADPLTNQTVAKDSDGGAVSSSFNFDLSGNGTRSNNNTNADKVIQFNHVIADETVAAGDKDFTLTNTAALFSNGDQTLFDLYVYVGRSVNVDDGESTGITVTLDSNATKTGTASTTNHSTGNTDFIAGQDYLVISGLQASTGDLQFDVVGSSTTNLGTGIGAFQIVETGVIPEPASLALVGVGSLLILGGRRQSV